MQHEREKRRHLSKSHRCQKAVSPDVLCRCLHHYHWSVSTSKVLLLLLLSPDGNCCCCCGQLLLLLLLLLPRCLLLGLIPRPQQR